MAGAEGREGASGSPRQDSALTLNELGAIARFGAEKCRIWPKFQQGHSGCCIEWIPGGRGGSRRTMRRLLHSYRWAVQVEKGSNCWYILKVEPTVFADGEWGVRVGWRERELEIMKREGDRSQR